MLTSSSTDSYTDSYEDAAAMAKLRKLIPGLPNPAILKGGIMQVLPYRIVIQ
jgi:hypothetical protein